MPGARAAAVSRVRPRDTSPRRTCAQAAPQRRRLAASSSSEWAVGAGPSWSAASRAAASRAVQRPARKSRTRWSSASRPVKPATAPSNVPAAAWAQLDGVDLQTEFAIRLPTMQGVPAFLRPGIRQAYTFSLRALRDALASRRSTTSPSLEVVPTGPAPASLPRAGYGVLRISGGGSARSLRRPFRRRLCGLRQCEARAALVWWRLSRWPSLGSGGCCLRLGAGRRAGVIAQASSGGGARCCSTCCVGHTWRSGRSTSEAVNQAFERGGGRGTQQRGEECFLQWNSEVVPIPRVRNCSDKFGQGSDLRVPQRGPLPETAERRGKAQRRGANVLDGMREPGYRQECGDSGGPPPANTGMCVPGTPCASGEHARSIAAGFRSRRGHGRRRVRSWRQWKLCLGRAIGSMFVRCNRSKKGFGPQGKWPCHVSERAFSILSAPQTFYPEP